MSPHLRSLRAIALLAGIACLTILVSILLVLSNLHGQRLATAQTQTENLAQTVVRQTELAFEGIDLLLKGVQDRLQSPYGAQFSLDSTATHLLLGARVSGSRQIDALFIVDTQGQIINTSKEVLPPGLSAQGRPYFKAFSEGGHEGMFIDKPTRSRSDGRITLYLSRSLSDGQGRLRGVVVAAIKIDHLEAFYSFQKTDIDRAVSLYAADGTLLTSVPQRNALIGVPAPELHNQALPPPGSGPRILKPARSDGARLALTLARVSPYPLLVSASHDIDEALASWRETAVTMAFAGCLVMVVILVSALMLARQVLIEEELNASLSSETRRHQQTLDTVMDAIIAVDAAQVIVLFNPAAERMFGLSRQQALGASLELLIPPRYRQQHGGWVQHFRGSNHQSMPMGRRQDVWGMRADGVEFPIEVTISKTDVGGSLQMTAVLRDISERHRAQQAIGAMTQELRGLSASLLEVREQERTRIARELHDELGQQLTGLKLDLAWLNTRIREGHAASAEQLESMRRLLDDCIGAVRRISTELRPIILDDLGFGEAVAWQAREVAKRSGLDIQVDLPAAHRIDSERWATPLFRIVQEALTNVVRHAQATQVWISVTEEEGRLVLRVRDNGIGIGSGKHGGFGLVSMRERSQALGGQVHVRGAPGSGTVVEVHLQLPADAAAPGEESP